MGSIVRDKEMLQPPEAESGALLRHDFPVGHACKPATHHLAVHPQRLSRRNVFSGVAIPCEIVVA